MRTLVEKAERFRRNAVVVILAIVVIGLIMVTTANTIRITSWENKTSSLEATVWAFHGKGP